MHQSNLAYVALRQEGAADDTLFVMGLDLVSTTIDAKEAATEPLSLEDQRGPFEVSHERDITMTTRDGVVLLADIYRPVGATNVPVLVRRTPYGKAANDLAEKFNEADYYASHGYLTVVQNTRGRFGSAGVFYPFVYEGLDGHDAIEWAAQLPGANGRVGTFGQSYGALSQYLAAAQRPPHLVTCIPISAYLGAFENYWYQRGALELNWTLSYFLSMAESALEASGKVELLAELRALKVEPSQRFSPLHDDALRQLPLTSWIERFGVGAPFLADILHHWKDGGYWWAVDLRRQFHNIDVPILHMGSWYDIANWDTPQYFDGIRSYAASERTRSNQALVMGPWAHLLPYNQPTSGGTGDIDFGPEAAVSLVALQRRWFDHYLKLGGAELPFSRVRIFVMGENQWRVEPEWPPPATLFTEFFLHSNGAANTAAGDGWLDAGKPGNEPADGYQYDPDQPVPTAGGRYVGGGVRDQRSTQARHDVLVYTAPPQAEPMEVTGPLEVTLYVQTSVVDTDFIAVVSDVWPDGFVQNLAEGIVRGRFRDRYDDPELMTPGQTYALGIEIGNLSHVVLPGHQLRLHITSSDFPRWDRNTNTAVPAPFATAVEVAQQVVLHDAAHPSCLRLPIASGHQ
jgi:putative CocE/NonD family hydrolase